MSVTGLGSGLMRIGPGEPRSVGFPATAFLGLECPSSHSGGRSCLKWVGALGRRSRAFNSSKKKRDGIDLIRFHFFTSWFAQHCGCTIHWIPEYIDTFDGYSFKYPQNWIQVRGAGADIFFRDPFVLDENISVNISSPSSSRYKTVEDLGSPEEAGKNVMRQYLTEFMSTRLGVRRESSILSTTSKVADDGKLYYEVEVNIKSYANNNELAVMPQDRVARLEWDRRYLSVLGVEQPII
ncbi:UNVERIFIED_CONTAM: PsbP domain-containing protein 1, chloroplastic [Sesamum angustifolium]|uniref:PsbP domain-containing protein 1, chloroplastic n=1 Tax=Sesamum angustifolium TaxID=2727405 RepID=A0AAW2QAP2_9LAMI